jgi:carboxypeptidase C (cathepsin A)
MPDMADFDTFGLYSGYLNVDEAKMLHYMFIESANEPSTDPLVIWFNGGPGCSSMLGFSQEHGPYQLKSGTDFWQVNDYSWNKFSNMLYIESPAGVGFSYCKGIKECNNYSDDQSAEDSLVAVLAFFEKFPEMKSHDLYISGESYAGIYVPYLSYYIDQYNTTHAAEEDVFKPNLKGFMVGNGVTNYDYDCTPAYIEMGYWHSLYSDELRDQMIAAQCDFGGMPSRASAECRKLQAEFNQLTASVNVYDIFGICYGPEPHPQMYQTNGEHEKFYTAADYTPFLETAEGANGLPPCTFGNPIIDYYARDDVRAALHIPDEVQAWDLCNMKISIEYHRGAQGSQWIYEALQGKYRMLHFSGDTDGAVPTLGTQGWIATLGWDVTEAWRPYTVDSQVAGYLESYAGEFTFATVHGAGHMAPQFKPPQTYHLIENWVNQTAI